MSDSFLDLLESLKNENLPLPVERLSELSDLDAVRVEQLRDNWSHVPLKRRLALIKELGTQADHHIEFCFDHVNRLGLTDLNAEIREIAIRNLWECEETDLATSFLASLLDDPEPLVRSAAANALGLFVLLGETNKINPDLLYDIEEGLISAAVEDQSDNVRRSSLESLGYSSRQEVAQLIQESYNSEDEAQIQSALLAMGRSANDEWNTDVLSKLHHPSPSIRSEAARAAGELEILEATNPLIELLEDVNQDVMNAAIWALGQIGGDMSAVALYQVLENAEGEELLQIIHDALDHLAFVDGTRDLLLIDYDDLEE
jgi:HEAT repeat protein